MLAWLLFLLLALVPQGVLAQPAAALPLLVTLQASSSAEPLAGVTCTLWDAQGQVVAEAVTDDAGQARVEAPPGGYTLTVAGATQAGLLLRLNAPYAAHGGLPIFVTETQPELVLLVDAATGLVGFGPILDRDTGSQEAVTPVMTPMPPVAPRPLTLVPLATVAAPGQNATPAAFCPDGAQPTLAGRTVICVPVPGAVPQPATASHRPTWPRVLLVIALLQALWTIGRSLWTRWRRAS